MIVHDFIILPKRAKDITNQRFGRLVAIGPTNRSRNGILWLCQCDCGKFSIVAASELRRKGTKSCGCLISDTSSRVNKTHGMRKHRIYGVWLNMRSRCGYERDIAYHLYGGRGISVCSAWQDSFIEFYSHVSVLPFYGEDGYTLDRIDNNANYEPGNVQWSSAKEQSRNTRRNLLLTFENKTQCVAAWADELKMDYRVLHHRIYMGWDIERALVTPVRTIFRRR